MSAASSSLCGLVYNTTPHPAERARTSTPAGHSRTCCNHHESLEALVLFLIFDRLYHTSRQQGDQTRVCFSTHTQFADHAAEEGVLPWLRGYSSVDAQDWESTLLLLSFEAARLIVSSGISTPHKRGGTCSMVTCSVMTGPPLTRHPDRITLLLESTRARARSAAAAACNS